MNVNNFYVSAQYSSLSSKPIYRQFRKKKRSNGTIKKIFILMNKPQHLHPTLILFIALISFCMGFRYTKEIKVPHTVVEVKEIPVTIYADNKKDEFSEKKLRKYLKELNVKYIDVVVAQAKLESNDFQSNIFKQNHNLFGMKLAVARSSTSHSEFSSHAVYKSWRESVLDYAMFQNTIIHKCKTVKQYKAYIQRNYSHTSTYMQRVEKIIRKG